MKRSVWTWLNTQSQAPVAPSPRNNFGRARLFGMFSDGFTVFGPYRRPIQPAAGGGQLYRRNLNPIAPNYVFPQQWTPVSVTGRGSELTGQFDTLGLVNVTTNSGGNSGSGGQI